MSHEEPGRGVRNGSCAQVNSRREARLAVVMPYPVLVELWS